MNSSRRYVDHGTEEEVVEWAYKQWQEKKARAGNGKPLWRCFSSSLREYIKHLKKVT